MNGHVILVGAFVAATAAAVWVGEQVLPTGEGSPSLVFAATLFAVLLGVLVLGLRGSAHQAVRHAFVWLAAGLALVMGYTYRSDVAAVLKPAPIEASAAKATPGKRSSGEVVLHAADDGHFYADADVNGSGIRMMVDTGASIVVLSEADAERAGINVDELDYTLVFSTANGMAKAAEVTIDEIRVGSIVRRDVRGAVTSGLPGSLLGMSYFSTLSKVAFESDELVLKD